MAAIKTDGLTKVFGGSVTAVAGIDLEVQRGEVYGFLGPNGSGKSTTINMLLNFVHPSDGTAHVLGYDSREDSTAIRERTGVLPEGASLYDRLTGREHIELTARLKGVDVDTGAIIDRVGLDTDDATRYAGEYSKGMGQRLRLGMALVGDPDLLILDEPSSGLDPQGIREMRKLIREEAEDGTAVFFSSHVLGEVEAVCDRVGILNHGELVAVDTIEGLQSATQMETTVYINVSRTDDDVLDLLSTIDGVSERWVEDDRIGVSVRDNAKLTVLNTLKESDVTVHDFTVEESTLEDLFAEYTSDKQVMEA